MGAGKMAAGDMAGGDMAGGDMAGGDMAGGDMAATGCELTLEVAPDRFDDVLKLLAGRSRRSLGEVRGTRAVWFDSGHDDLRRAGLELCVLEEGGRAVQSLRAGIGPATAETWRAEVDGHAPDLAAAARTPLAARIRRGALAGGLRPRFEVRSETMTAARGRGDGRVAVALERAVVEAGGDRQEICRVRLAHASALAPVVRLARELRAAVPLQVAPGDAAFGYRLAEAGLTRPEKDIRVVLRPGETLQEGIRAVVAAVLEQLVWNERLFRGTRAPEALHQLRVAVRRTRAALSLFGSRLAPAGAAQARAELRWISGLLGAARDLDVFVAKTIKRAREKHPHAPGFEELAGALERRREAAYAALIAGLQSQRFFDMVLDLVTLAEENEAEGALADFAREELRRRLRSLRRRSRALAKLDAEARHEVRLKAKKLRYMLEFVADARFAGGARRLGETLQEIQDALGSLNDAAVGDALMVEVASDPQVQAKAPLALFAAGVVAGDTTVDPAPFMERAAKAVARLRADRAFRD